LSTEVEVLAGDVAARAMVTHSGSGAMALAVMPDEEFERRLAAMKKGQERVRRIQLELMEGPTEDNPEGVDYGVIPGTKKPTLLKPGAEKICNAYGLVPTFEETWVEGDGLTSPHLRLRMKCLLHVGDAEGPVVGQGVGAANSWERKHRWRRGERACPSCGVEGSILRSKNADETGDRGWFCWAKKGGCGANFSADAPAIVQQEVGDVENKDPYDTENTLLKMAKKRSHVDATLTTTATSGLFSQDVEDVPHAAPQPKAAAPQRQAPPPPAPAEAEFPVDEEAYSRHSVEPPAPPAAAAGQKPACPKCGSHKRVGLSKFPKKGAYYCGACTAPFGPTS
jgi:hypothetical protein